MMARRQPGRLNKPKYEDPIPVILLSLPLVNHDIQQRLAVEWDSVKPVSWVIRTLNWYADHDRGVLWFVHLIVATTPIALSAHGVSVPWLIAIAIVSMSIVGWLDRVGLDAEQEQLIDETLRRYYRKYNRPIEKQQKRQLRREMREVRI